MSLHSAGQSILSGAEILVKGSRQSQAQPGSRNRVEPAQSQGYASPALSHKQRSEKQAVTNNVIGNGGASYHVKLESMHDSESLRSTRKQDIRSTYTKFKAQVQ